MPLEELSPTNGDPYSSQYRFATESAPTRSKQPMVHGERAGAGGPWTRGIRKSGTCWPQRVTAHRWRVC